MEYDFQNLAENNQNLIEESAIPIQVQDKELKNLSKSWTNKKMSIVSPHSGKGSKKCDLDQ